MIIQAKFKSVCPSCQNEILSGSFVEWKKGSTAIHKECFEKQQQEIKEAKKQEWENQDFRIGDTIEISEDIYFNGIFGNKNELVAPKGTKAKIIGDGLKKASINGKYVDIIPLEEKVRKGSEPKTKTVYFAAPIESMTIIKKAKF